MARASGLLTGARPGFGNRISCSHRRTGLKKIIRWPWSTEAERIAARAELRGQPRDTSATRVRNRDQADGRPRGCLRAFGLARVNLRGQAHNGFLPGVRKSSR
ncbi:30S ribosomal protein S14 [Streptomyces sp. NPDC007205]|uniref:30S ribosomal protein S14 n=1 Tax=Streptomyces sp. NPDC007205 TaxID=3154316 RepID=UPI0033CD6DAF